MTDHKILLAALLWLRNHYDTYKGDDAELKRMVVARIDSVLNENESITIADMRAFRLLYPTPTWRDRSEL